jgi:PAS domain S-box-containing protein
VDKETIRVLLVDDDQGDFEMFRVMLSKTEHQEFKVDWVPNFDEALDAFEAGEHDVYFLDYFLEDRTGLDLLREARNRGVDAPIIMLTGRGSRKVDMEAMELGASDYLVKGLIDPDSLERSVRHALERRQGTRALEEREERLGISGAEPGQATAANVHHGDSARFWAVFEATRSGIALVDLQGNVLKVNAPFAEMFSPTPRFTEGLTLLDLVDESDRESAGKELEILARGERPRFEAARRFLSRDGKAVWAHSTSILIRDEEGDPDHLMVVLERAEGS